jgi:hypothetical protein
VCFVDEGSAEVKVPEGFTIIDHSNGDIQVQKFAGRVEYVLAWSDKYSLRLNEALVLELVNQRQ